MGKDCTRRKRRGKRIIVEIIRERKGDKRRIGRKWRYLNGRQK